MGRSGGKDRVWEGEGFMKLSVVVPVYNMAAGGKLEYCLNSLIAQTAEDYEIICVDDVSTDESYRILKEYEEKYRKKIRVFRMKENGKQGAARNLGMSYARGEWIGFFDSDDFAAADMYEKLLSKAADTGADVVGCQYQITGEQSMKPGRAVVNNTKEQTGVLGKEQYKLLMRKPGSMVIKIYKREVIEKYGLRFPEKVFYEDNCAAPVWMLHFKHFELVDEPLYYYYQHDASTVHHISLAKCEDRLTTGKMLVEWCKKAGFYEPYKRELEYRFTELYYVNTLFSYVVGKERVKIRFLDKMARGMKEEFPDFQKNPYYIQAYDEEQKRLIRYHMRSSVLFLIYYRALNGYRKVRKKIRVLLEFALMV